VLQLRVFGAAPTIAVVARQLEELAGVRHVLRTGDGAPGSARVTTDLDADVADRVVEGVLGLGVAPEDVDLLRLDSIGPEAAMRPATSLIWADLVAQAGANARPLARYVVFMAAAGVIAAFGVIYRNGILVVGAMAISPDTLPITAACTALVLRRWALAGRALATLTIGLVVAGAIAALMTLVLNVLDLLPAGFEIGSGGLQGLQTVNVSTPIVALAAGVAAVLALETRASSSVGVAISVTTIPASAYLGVAAGVGETSRAAGALAVLGVNVAMLLVGGCALLLVQRSLGRRKARTHTVVAPTAGSTPAD
jgi:uncharacterized hydrophobic protein (TIGR00271 family)